MTETTVDNNGCGDDVPPKEEEWCLHFQGAESKVWFGVYNGVKAVKKERFVKNYRVKELDTRLTRERTRAEVRSINKIIDKSPELGPLMPTILLVDNESNTIIMTRIEDSVNICEYLQKESNEQSVDQLLTNLGKIIGQIHNCGIVHGDLTTSNFLITNNNQIIPIDFGLSSSSTTAEDRAVDLYVLERAIISTHPDINFEKVLESYDKNIDKTKIKPKNDVLKRLEAVRLRGRKRLLIG